MLLLNITVTMTEKGVMLSSASADMKDPWRQNNLMFSISTGYY